MSPVHIATSWRRSFAVAAGCLWTLNSPAGAETLWRMAVLDGMSPGQRDAVHAAVEQLASLPVGRDDRPRAAEGASWKLQLGSVDPSHSQRAHFGPDGGLPIAGDFNGDGFDELGIFVDGHWFVDFNGNGVWDADDWWLEFGEAGDRPIVGDWDQDEKVDVGVVATGRRGRPADRFTEPTDDGSHPYRSWITVCTQRACFKQDRLREIHFGAGEMLPVVGDWNGRGNICIGAFQEGAWILDSNGNGKADPDDETFQLGEAGDLPVVGDFNRDGKDEVGIYRRGWWQIDTTGDRRFDQSDLQLILGDENDLPVVGDWDGDGLDQIGLFAKP